jgi:hypothetical protein
MSMTKETPMHAGALKKQLTNLMIVLDGDLINKYEFLIYEI